MNRLSIHDFMTTAELAQFLGVHRQTVHYRVRTGKLRPVRHGGRYLFLRAEVEGLRQQRLHRRGWHQHIAGHGWPALLAAIRRVNPAKTLPAPLTRSEETYIWLIEHPPTWWRGPWLTSVDYVPRFIGLK